MSSLKFKRIALIGIGLIGSSIAHAARRAGIVEHIAGSARTQDTIDTALRLGIIDSGSLDPKDAVAGADLIFVCVPVGASGKVAEQISSVIAKDAIVSDVGSVKKAVLDAMAPYIPSHAHFVPGHPVAGTEQSGPAAGFAELFDGRWCILTPDAGTNEDAVQKLTAFWQALGSRVEVMDAEHHDLVLAITSHVPHLIAYNIVNTAAHLERVTDREVIKFSAGGFRDFTRIASSDPTMWRDVFLSNKEAALEMLARFSEDLSELQRAIRFGDGDKLFELFSNARALRQNIIEAGQDIAQPDFGRSEKSRS